MLLIYQTVILNKQTVGEATTDQTLYTVDLNGQVSGIAPVTKKTATLNGDINGLILWNNAGKDVSSSADNSVALNAILRK